MNKLWVFGDSYSEPFSKLNGMEWKPNYINWKGYIPKSYGEFVSEYFNLFYVNHAIGGADNYTIFEKIVSVIDNIDSNDIIIIGWSHTLRFRVVNKMGVFNTIRPSSLDVVFDVNRKTPYLDISDNTLREITLNRNNQAYIDELNTNIKLLNFIFKNNKIIHWSPFKQDSVGLNTTTKSLNDLEVIAVETNSIIDDKHYSENAHKLISNQFIEVINNYDLFKSKKSLI